MVVKAFAVKQKAGLGETTTGARLSARSGQPRVRSAARLTADGAPFFWSACFPRPRSPPKTSPVPPVLLCFRLSGLPNR
jgi:hypothetical protein